MFCGTRNRIESVNLFPLNRIDNVILKLQNRITFANPADLLVSCESVFHRGFYADHPMMREEAELPIAYARVVFRVSCFCAWNANFLFHTEQMVISPRVSFLQQFYSVLFDKADVMPCLIAV